MNDNKQTVWDRMSPLQREIAKSKDRKDAAARARVARALAMADAYGSMRRHQKASKAGL